MKIFFGDQYMLHTKGYPKAQNDLLPKDMGSEKANNKPYAPLDKLIGSVGRVKYDV